MDIAKIFRICEIEIDDDFVTKRESAIKHLKTIIQKQGDVGELLKLASGVCEVFRTKPNLADSLSQQITTAIQKYNKSFEFESRAVDISATGFAAVIGYIEEASPNTGHWSNTDVLAAGIWSVTDLIGPIDNVRLEELRAYGQETARARILQQGLTSREREKVPPLTIADEILAARLAANVNEVVTVLRDNSAMDREEIDLLWWVLAGRSEILNKPLSELNSASRAIVAGIEIGSKVRYLPSLAFNNLAIKDLPDPDKLINMASLIAEVGDFRESIAADYKAESLVTLTPNVFPLLNALLTNDVSSLITDNQKTLSDWAARAMLERAILKVQYYATREL